MQIFLLGKCVGETAAVETCTAAVSVVAVIIVAGAVALWQLNGNSDGDDDGDADGDLYIDRDFVVGLLARVASN